MTADAPAAEELERDSGETLGVACPECGKLVNPRGLGLHRAHAHGYRAGEDDGAPRQRGRRTMRADKQPSVDLAEEQDRLVTSLATMGMFVSAVLPHTGITLVSRAADRDLELPIPGAAPQKVHKKGISTVVMEYARRDVRVLQAVVRFNQLMHAGDAVELLMSVAAAVAVDTHLVDPHLHIPMPGAPPGVEIRPVEALIGDVVQQVEMQFGSTPEPEGQAPEPNGVPA